MTIPPKCQDIEELTKAIGDTYQVDEKEGVLLHGYLHIQIIRGTKLKNADINVRGMLGGKKDVSDPYVTVHAGINRLLKTPYIPDELNPEWNFEHFLPIGQHVEEIEFRVKDFDTAGASKLGQSTVPVEELIRFDENKKQLRTGVHKIVYLDGKPSHGTFEYMIEFIPKDFFHAPPALLPQPPTFDRMTAKGVYFPLRQQNHVRLYINADDHGKNPIVMYGDDNHKMWKPRRYFRDVYDSICQASEMICIVGWSVDHTIALLRGSEATEGLNPRPGGGSYSPYIGELLKAKADEGVVVNMLVWDDKTSNALNITGVVATKDEELRAYFKGSNVNLRLVPMDPGDTNIAKKLRQSVYYTHHQKCVIVDTPKKELLAYVGGIDLTYGRYEDGSYALFRTLKTLHKEDFHQACYTVSQANGPREPWKDIHSRVKGQGALDLYQNFQERWIGQGGKDSDLVKLEEKGIQVDNNIHGEDDEGEASWSTQLCRSVDSKTAQFWLYPDNKMAPFKQTENVEFQPEEEIKPGKRAAIMNKIKSSEKQMQQSFIGRTGENVEINRPLDLKREVQIDSSAHKSLIHHIRNAQHFIYMESQYFLSSSFLWEKKTDKCCNLVAAEITWKICEKIEAGERFAAYIVVPMWPEGISESASVQDILYTQAQTMKGMYKRIQASIDRQKAKDSSFMDVTPTDYLNFFCLAARETEAGGQNAAGADGKLNKTRRGIVYTHSKMTIVDDQVILVGSANINQRSMDGNRDSELFLNAWQPDHLATTESVANGDIHGFRLYCFAHLTGEMDELYRNPSSLECVRRINNLAKANWRKFEQDKVVDMTYALVYYPVVLLPSGALKSVTENGKFPDTDAHIIPSKGLRLPEFLTT